MMNVFMMQHSPVRIPINYDGLQDEKYRDMVGIENKRRNINSKSEIEAEKEQININSQHQKCHYRNRNK